MQIYRCYEHTMSGSQHNSESEQSTMSTASSTPMVHVVWSTVPVSLDVKRKFETFLTTIVKTMVENDQDGTNTFDESDVCKAVSEYVLDSSICAEILEETYCGRNVPTGIKKQIDESVNTNLKLIDAVERIDKRARKNDGEHSDALL